MFEEILSSGGIPSICSANPAVLRETLRAANAGPVLIEATCNQVNQFGGYTGMTPVDFAAYVRDLAGQAGGDPRNVILGGDHLGPFVWQAEPAEAAMQKSLDMIRAYVSAGFTKLHLDCSVRLGDDPAGPLDPRLLARRAALLARAAEETAAQAGQPSMLRYVIGTEVPTPGGALEHEEGVSVTCVADVSETIELHRRAFTELGLQVAWERVLAVVVQPGVEFGDDFVLPYRPEKARELSAFIRGQGLVYEAHSTDYQTPAALRELVRDRFAILKVGPALTFAYREAIFALALMEDELVPVEARSNLMAVLEETMLRKPEHWRKYYTGSPAEQAFKRKYSLSDRIRYYWSQPEVRRALERLLGNLGAESLPLALASQFAPLEKAALEKGGRPLNAANIISARIASILTDYWNACQANPSPDSFL